MDKLTKVILAFALAFLAVIIGIGIGNRSAYKVKEPLYLPEPPKILERPEKKEDKIKTTKEKLTETRKEKVVVSEEEPLEKVSILPELEEEVSPETSSAQRRPSPRIEPPLLPGDIHGMPEMYPPEAPLPVYPPGEYPEESGPGEAPPPELPPE